MPSHSEKGSAELQLCPFLLRCLSSLKDSKNSEMAAWG